MDKTEIRQLILQRKRQHTEQQLRELSLAAVGRLMENPRVRAAATILMYYSMPGEVCTHGLVEALRAAGKRVLLPRTAAGGAMCLVPYTGPACLSRAAGFNVLEPQGEPFTRYGDIDVAVVPGIAFTAAGCRMGRGGGYYDRFLASAPAVHKIGLCFPFQVLPSIPAEPHDVMMDEVVW